MNKNSQAVIYVLLLGWDANLMPVIFPTQLGEVPSIQCLQTSVSGAKPNGIITITSFYTTLYLGVHAKIVRFLRKAFFRLHGRHRIFTKSRHKSLALMQRFILSGLEVNSLAPRPLYWHPIVDFPVSYLRLVVLVFNLKRCLHCLRVGTGVV